MTVKIKIRVAVIAAAGIFGAVLGAQAAPPMCSW